MKPLLSILVPSYEYTIGVKNILNKISEAHLNEIEVVIYDDSASNDIKHHIDNYRSNENTAVIYRKNNPPLGAVKNWNSLLRSGNGAYLMLLHHDECPENIDFFQKVLYEIKKCDSIDIYIVNCIVEDQKKIQRPHLPRYIREWVVRYQHEYIFRRNAIGPVSSLIVRRELHTEFDEKLHWFVDVDYYYRLLKKSTQIKFLQINIISTIDRKDSITSKLKGTLDSIKSSERTYLAEKHPQAAKWLRECNGFLINSVEHLLWIAIRVLTRMFYSLNNAFNYLSVICGWHYKKSKK